MLPRIQREDSMKAKVKVNMVTLVIVATVALVPYLASGQSLLSERTVSLDAAIEMASASLERCRADGYKVTITVLNRHARTALVFSDDGATPHTLENSMRKAYTAFTTRAPSGEMNKRPEPLLKGFLVLDKLTVLEGGLPIFAGKELVGAIGVSGSPGGDKDAACAKVGIDKIAKKLAE
jgi:uncharacterized protein GlcG (DUF336 family)